MRAPDADTMAAIRADGRAHRKRLANTGLHPRDPEYHEDEMMENDMPAWARWVAMDADSTWHYYEYRPKRFRAIWGAISGREQLAEPRAAVADWRESLAAVGLP